MIKLAALGALGYAGYKYFQKNQIRGQNVSENAVAGGPLSDKAQVHSAGSSPVR